MNDRIVEIEKYWTSVVRDTAEFQQLAHALNSEFNRILGCIYRILKDAFITDATEYGVSRWEKILELPVNPSATLEERKVQILTYLSIRRPYTIRVLKQMLTGLLGEGNFEVYIDNDAQTLTIVLVSTVESMREKIDELCARVIPQNLVIEITDMPLGYTRLEFLESTGSQYIDTGLHIDNGSAMSVTCSINPDSGVNSGAVFGAQVTSTNTDRAGWSEYTKGDHGWVFWAWTSEDKVVPTDPAEKHKVELSQAGLYYNGTLLKDLRAAVAFKTSLTCWLFARNRPDVNVEKYHGKIYAFTFAQAGSPRLNLIPALDPTGAPCMFDMVTRKPFYNAGTGDFLYPTDTAPVMTLDLDEKFYAKRTEHGIRRLYHVPEGCNMTKDEYAAKNGFKEILEPPMPLEGYWVPEWKETETQLICEWVETEPPTEEGIEND